MRCCFGVLGSQQGVRNLSCIKVQWARARFSFWFCPHSVPSFYPFSDRQRHLFRHFCFWLVDSFSSSPFGHLPHTSSPAGSCARRLTSVVKLKSLQCFMLLEVERSIMTLFFPHCSFCSLTAVESAVEALMSSQRLHFVDIINLSACQSSCPVQGCHKQTLVDVIELYATEAACFHLFSLPFIPGYAEKHVV